MRLSRVIACAVLPTALGVAQAQQSPLPSFRATALTGQVVTEQKLIGQPTVLIVTPSREAAEETREWAEALRRTLDQQKVRVRDVLAIDLPFFMSERDALDRAREKIPDRYHDQTWLLSESSLEQALNVPPSSEDAYVLVLNSQGRVVERAHGSPTQPKLRQVENAVQKLTG